MDKKIALHGKYGEGLYTIVDDADFEWLNSRRWRVSAQGYPAFTLHLGYKSGKRQVQIVLMHRIVANTPFNQLTDHINRNPLDNRLINLRNCNKQMNAWNSKVFSSTTSGYRGVNWSTQAGRWHAQIKHEGTLIHLGFFTDKKEAAYVYDQVALQLREEFAQSNLLC